ncbi:MAG: LysE/ArgO family amino acid transporter [Jannaschia helgolandensis]|uniref:L-lysine exporter family protein LysE/ArgO n=1 Tax=Jannaschia helgolandensis TaxID=188906 RepID=A0A1H7PD43_9RHOB|nr:LysE/ArgO family amino acid transporter [Jannaschia helgolandensis]SEL33378.1 L-lysine exporter family protein LysE/ArgO [Jannaschia helgolandensis]|tara:strand:- start:67 stop:660 length:594 start_codon:yes stop_codon:yes gene_type:complete
MTSFLSGFGLGLSLILAIGAQNAFVLRQGLRGEHVLAVVLTCALSDALLVAAGVAGFGILVETVPWIVPLFRWGGAAFLIVYGGRAALAAWRGGSSLQAAAAAGGLRRAVTICLALTWLNPHVYLDTLILLGSISTQAASPVMFGVGAVASSFAFFFALGYGATLLRPVFTRPVAWRVLDGLIAIVMWSIAISLLRG